MILRNSALRLSGIFTAGLFGGVMAVWLLWPDRESVGASKLRPTTVISILRKQDESAFARDSMGAVGKDFPQILAEIRRYPFGDIGDQLNELSERWASESPAEAFEAFLNARELPDRHYVALLNRVVATWTKIDPEAALASADAVDDESLSLELVVSVLVETNPAEALDRLESMRAPPRPDLYALVFSSWTGRDAAEATEQLSTLQNSKLKSEATLAVAVALAGQDMAGALDWAASLDNDSDRTESLVRIIETSAERDPDAAAAGLQLLEEGPRKDYALGQLMVAWAAQDPRAALAWLHHNAKDDEAGRSGAYSILAGNLVTIDPGLATALFEEIPVGRARTEAAAGLAEGWAKSDPRAAFDWAHSLQGAERSRALRTVANYWSMWDPEAAGAFAANLPDDPALQAFRSNLVSNWMTADPDGAIAWAASLQGEDGRNVYRQAISSWTSSGDPQGAAQHVESLEDRALRQKLAEEVAVAWVRLEPSDAAAWAGRMLDASSEARSARDAFREVARVFSQLDPLNASQWVATLTEGPGREAAVKALIENIIDSDPAGAAAWAETLPDSAYRESVRDALKD